MAPSVGMAAARTPLVSVHKVTKKIVEYGKYIIGLSIDVFSPMHMQWSGCTV